jgi:aryl-alcohol dehydrogenase-like predicted oxidoreductase
MGAMERMHEYRTLGRTGLKVSPLGLGVMTYGWGADEDAARTLFDLYREAGGNFLDTADMYQGGESEEWLGRFVADAGVRDEVVIATKFSFNAQEGNPNAGGNGRKNIRRALEGSLRRLRTDHVDVYVLHAWDRVTPVEEVLATLDDLVREGKVLHVGLSDTPAWYASRFQALAEAHGRERLALLQLEYSLVSRSLEREHVPLAQETGISIVPWSPLGSGFLTGKYARSADGTLSGSGRVAQSQGSGNPSLEKFTREPRNWEVLDELRAVADEVGRPMAEVALAWVRGRPQVTSVLVGATRPDQLELNLRSLTLDLPPELADRLSAAGRPPSNELDHFFEPTMQAMVHGGVPVTRGV